MNVSEQELASLRGLAGTLKRSLQSALRTEGLEQGELLKSGISMAAQLETQLEQAGAEPPATLPPTWPLPDTPATQRYAAALHDAWAAGLAVNQERSDTEIGMTEMGPDGAVLLLEMLLAGVEEEWHGPNEIGSHEIGSHEIGGPEAEIE